MTPIKLALNMITISDNDLYGYNAYSRSVYLKPEAKQWKLDAVDSFRQQLDALNYDVSDLPNKLKLTIKIESSSWVSKNGKTKKKDLSNCTKALIDSLFQALNADDSLIYELKLVKVIKNSDIIKIRISNAV